MTQGEHGEMLPHIEWANRMRETSEVAKKQWRGRRTVSYDQPVHPAKRGSQRHLQLLFFGDAAITVWGVRAFTLSTAIHAKKRRAEEY